ncbi:MAG: hypothetical protein ACNA7W_17415 [Pseudomonadales bacterium]
MSLLKIGHKDRHGRQKRIEHSGPYLRASRTGGVSLRAQTRVAAVNATANTRHGLRLSTRLARNTQVAVQNGRFVLRGRYGSDAAKINLSKSGVSVSTRTPTGTVNWVRPGSSSFKLAGVQVRGQKAVWLQLIHLLLSVVVSLLDLIVKAVSRLLTLLATGLGAGVQQLQARRHLAAEESLLAALEQEDAVAQANALLAERGVDLRGEAARDLLASLSYCLVCLGRGESAFEPRAHALDPGASAAHGALHADLATAGQVIGNWLPAATAAGYPALALGLSQLLAQALAVHLDEPARVEGLLALDDACLASGPKTVLQEAMIDRLAETWQLQFALDGEA